MILRWNAVVAPDDTVYHLGDFAMGKASEWPTILRQLNGTRKILLLGSHDRSPRQMLEGGFTEAHEKLEWDGWLLQHKPIKTQQKLLCGHIHEKWLRLGWAINVGVDVWDFTPRTIEELTQAIQSPPHYKCSHCGAMLKYLEDNSSHHGGKCVPMEPDKPVIDSKDIFAKARLDALADVFAEGIIHLGQNGLLPLKDTPALVPPAPSQNSSIPNEKREKDAGKSTIRSKPSTRLSKKELETMTEEATVDCNNESEQVGGWFNMIEEHLKVPFETRLLGICVTVERVDMNRNDEIVAVCRRDKHRQTIPILDLPLPVPPPAGVEWIEAYRRWVR